MAAALLLSPKKSSLQKGQALHILRSGQLRTTLYFELPMPISRLQLLMQPRMGSHALLVEQRVGLLGQPSPGFCAAALYVRPGRLEMKGALFFNAPILPTFAASFGHCTKMLTAPLFAFCVAQRPEGCLSLPGSHPQVG